MKPLPHAICENVPSAFALGVEVAFGMLLILGIVGGLMYARWRWLEQ